MRRRSAFRDTHHCITVRTCLHYSYFSFLLRRMLIWRFNWVALQGVGWGEATYVTSGFCSPQDMNYPPASCTCHPRRFRLWNTQRRGEALFVYWCRKLLGAINKKIDLIYSHLWVAVLCSGEGEPEHLGEERAGDEVQKEKVFSRRGLAEWHNNNNKLISQQRQWEIRLFKKLRVCECK